MKSLDFGRCALTCCAPVAMLAGCGGSQPPIGAAGAMPQSSALAAHTTPRWSALKPGAPSLGYKTTAPLLYATNTGNFNVTVYWARGKDPTPLATISEGLDAPFGACIDGQGTLYVTNEPAYCTIDANGNLWVANAGGANVTEYREGSKKPHTVITEGLREPVGIAL